MSILLKQTALKNFVHHLFEGEQVVRNPKVQALMAAKLPGVPPEYLKILATPVFSGSRVNETILWQTDAFASEPVPLPELTGAERERYEGILEDAFKRLGSAVSSIEGQPACELLRQSITYHSKDDVFCAEGRIVITEWGMHPFDGTARQLPFGVDIDMPREWPAPSPAPKPAPEVPGPGPEEPGRERPAPPEPRRPDPPVTPPRPAPAPAPVQPEETSEREDDGGIAAGHKPPLWKKLLPWILALLAALLAALLLPKGCSAPAIAPTAPEVNPVDISPSRDSLTMEVNNRLLILILDGGTVNEFVSRFREIYPDESKYQFACADTLLPRVMLILPKEEKEAMMETLPERFPEWELEILPDTIFGVTGTKTNDPDLNDDEKSWYFDACSVYDAWDVTRGSGDVVVAIIDDGFDLSHPELSDRIIDRYNAVTHDRNVFPSESGHGTHVSATAIGAADNSEGTAGIAPGCRYLPIQVGDRNGVMATSSVLDGVLYAIQQKADVVNMSLGMSFSPFMQFVPVPIQLNYIANNFLAEERVWRKVFDMADSHNVTFVLAGGNENVLVGLDPMQRSPKTIKVSAVQPDRVKADFSNYGDYSTLSAPGVHIYNAVPGGYAYMDGTSMASPIVTGGVALLKSRDRSLTTSQVADILRRTGVPSPSAVGPIVNFADALNAKPGGESSTDDGTDRCRDYQKRYDELLAELEKLRKEHPGCISAPDTMTIPPQADLSDITGTWKSTTSLYNEQGAEVVLYFTFNGTGTGSLSLVEPDNTKYPASLELSISNDRIYINQTSYAQGPNNRRYPPYKFVCRPDKNRHADCSGENITDASNKIHFNLIRIN